MTRIATDAGLSTLAGLGGDSDRLLRQQSTDDLIARNRAVTSQAVAEQRQTPRMSIAELNSTDFDTLVDRMSRSRRDDRPSYIKALDLIDLPRNTIANTIFPAAARQQARRGERATFGLPRVMFSDALKEMGVDNRIVLGLVGLLGDVALDPLTYVGGAGVVRAVGTKGTTLISKSGARELNRGISATARGGLGTLRDPEVANLIQAAGFGDEAIAAARQAGQTPAQIRSDISNAILGDITGGRVLSRIGGDLRRGGQTGGGLIAERAFQRLDDETVDEITRGQIDAVARFVEKFNPTRRPGLRIGNAGTQVAHIPFTDVGISVPAFTPNGRAAVAGLAVARANELVRPRDIADPRVQEAFTELRDSLRSLDEGAQRLKSTSESIRGIERSIREAGDDAAQVEALTLERSRLADLAGLTADTLQQENTAAVQRIDTLMDQIQPRDLEGAGANRVVAVGEMVRAAQGAQEYARQQARIYRMAAEAGKTAAQRDAEIAELAASGDVANAMRRMLAAERSDEVGDAVLELVDADSLGAEQLADSFHAVFGAGARLGEALHYPIDNLTRSPFEDAALRYVAQEVMAIDDLSLGASLLSSVADAAEGVGGGSDGLASRVLRGTDSQLRKVFGVRSGHLQRMLATVKANLGSQRKFQVMAREEAKWRQGILRLMRDLSIPVADYDTVATLALAKTLQVAGGSGPSYPLQINGELTAFGRSMQAFGNLNLTDEARTALTEGLEQIGNEAVTSLRQVGEAEIGSEILSAFLPDYVPNVATEAAQRAINVQRGTFPFPAQAGARATGVGAREGFQRQRSLWQRVFTDPETGQEHRIFEFELGAFDAAGDDFARLEEAFGPVIARQVAGKADAIRRYRALIEANGGRDVATFVPTDPFTANELYQQGLFRLLTGSSPKIESFFETSLPMVMASRMAQHQRAVAKRELFQIIAGVSRRINDADLQRLAQAGTEITLPSGSTAKVVPGSDGKGPRVIIGGVRYRPLAPDIRNQTDGLLAGMLTDARDFVVPEVLADRIEDTATLLQPDNYGRIFRALERITGVWKSITLTHPSWFIVNAVGNAALAITGGASPAAMAGHAANATKLILRSNDPDKLAAMTVTVGGRQISGADLVRVAAENRVIGNNAVEEMMSQATRRGIRTVIGRGSGPAAAVQNLGDIPAEARLAYNVYASAGRGVAEGGARAAADVVSDRAKRFAIPWFRLNQRLDDSMRLMAFMAHLDNGDDVATAAEKTIRSMFDYGDLSQVEAGAFRAIVPFYCVPCETSQALTRSGWKYHDELNVGEDLLTYNVESARLEWQPLQSVHVFDCDQDIEVFETKKWRMEYTSEHRWIATDNYKPDRRRLLPASELKSHHRIVMAAPLDDSAESMLTPDQARLYGWLLTDGHWRFRGNHCEAVLYQTPQKHLAEAVSVAGRDPRPSVHPVSKQRTITVRQDRIKPLIEILRPGKNHAKHVVPNLSRAAAEAMLEAMMQADGCRNPQRGEAAHQFIACSDKYPGKREGVEILLVLLGKRFTQNDRGFYIHRSGCDHVKVASGTRSRKRFVGKVWCPRTPNGTFILKQDGTVTATGNTWMRNNLAYQMRLALTDPKWQASVPKLNRAIEDVLTGDERVPEQERPDWMRRSLAVQLASNPEQRYALLTSNILPAAEHFNVLQGLFGEEGAQEMLRYFGSSLNPLFMAPLQIGAGAETFSGRTIGPQADITTGEFLAQQIRPISEVQKTTRAFDRSTTEGVSRIFLGGRIQDFSQERLESTLGREIRDEERRIRAAINRRERRGQGSASERASLMQLYQKALELGREDLVPRWAQEQLSLLSITN